MPWKSMVLLDLNLTLKSANDISQHFFLVLDKIYNMYLHVLNISHAMQWCLCK